MLTILILTAVTASNSKKKNNLVYACLQLGLRTKIKSDLTYFL